MSIKEKMFLSSEAIEEHYDAGDFIFKEGAIPQFYYLLVNGEIKINSVNKDGKEFIQNILTANTSFGESMLILGKPYPVNAVALTPCTVLKIGKEQFFQLLKNNPDHFFDLYQILSENTLDKGEITQKLTQESADDRLMKILKQLKDGHPDGVQFSYEILLKRQELAALAGLSLETTIRTVKKMERDGILIIKNGKIFY